MISIFNRIKIFEDTSSIELARVTGALKKNEIKYEVVTKRNQTNIDMMMHTSIAASVGHGGAYTYNQAIGNISYLYKVYVRKKDVNRAKEIL